MKQNPIFNVTSALLKERYGTETGTNVMEYAYKKYEELRRENETDPKAVKAQTETKIYPGISLLMGMLEEGIERNEAISFLDMSICKESETQAKQLRNLMKIPGLYKLMPVMFNMVTKKQFGEAAGFKYHFYPTDRNRSKFDMTTCLFCEVCKKYNCPDLVKCYCHTDDVCNGHMHPKLCWNRTKTMGEGGDVCDFDLYIKK